MRDTISITALSLRTPNLERDLWNKPSKSQPLFLSLSISTDVSSEAISDSLLGESLNYGTVTKAIEKAVKELEGELALEVLADYLAKVIILKGNAPNVTLELTRPKALLTADSIGVSITRSRSDYSSLVSSPSFPDYFLSPDAQSPQKDTFFVRDLRRYILIGVNDCERVDSQEVIVNLVFGAEDMLGVPFTGLVARNGWKGWREVVRKVENHLTISEPETIEAITTSMSQIILTPPISPSTFNVPTTTVRLSKPDALMFARYPSVEVNRSRSDFFRLDGSLRTRSTSTIAVDSMSSSVASSFFGGSEVASVASTAPTESGSGAHRAYLGVGTNMGQRMGNISRALKELERVNGEEGKTRVTATSFLYESEAMYVTEQASFLNAVIEIETDLEPRALLSLLKSVEQTLGRAETIRNGPRVIDLDILLYDDLVYDSTSEAEAVEKDSLWLKIPHASIAEREFVLRPLADLIPDLVHPSLNLPISSLLTSVLSSGPSTLHRIIPLSSSSSHPLASRTLVMSILNATPDSFSDGGDNHSVKDATATALSHIASGVDILDIGGMSTRPGASDVSEEIEISRVVPLIHSIRSTHPDIPISIDTFRPLVAQAAIEAGATMINDVLGGSYPGMLEMMAKLDVPVILMHSRGMPQTMSEMTDYPNDDVVNGVIVELRDRVQRAIDMGVKRWNIITDPGIGFAKTGKQNLVLLRRLSQVIGTDPYLGSFPSLVGLSRKKFLGTLVGKAAAKERVWGTASGVTASIAGGADIVRVHDLKEMVDVVKVADGIYRS